MVSASVLLVGEDAELAAFLQQSGLSCILTTAEKALAALENGPIDLALLDLTPGKDGVALLRGIKQQAPLVEVILLAASASVAAGIDCIKYGAFEYLVKPVEHPALLAILVAAQAHRQRQQARIRTQQV